jgi:hypothetical protein
VTGRWFSQGTLVSSTNKTNRFDTAEIIVESCVKHPNPNSDNQLLRKDMALNEHQLHQQTLDAIFSTSRPKVHVKYSHHFSMDVWKHFIFQFFLNKA